MSSVSNPPANHEATSVCRNGTKDMSVNFTWNECKPTWRHPLICGLPFGSLELSIRAVTILFFGDRHYHIWTRQRSWGWYWSDLTKNLRTVEATCQSERHILKHTLLFHQFYSKWGHNLQKNTHAVCTKMCNQPPSELGAVNCSVDVSLWLFLGWVFIRSHKILCQCSNSFRDFT